MTNSTNPVFNTNRLKLGTFSSNGKAPNLTTVPEAYLATWPLTLQLARMADAAGLEAIVPYARWKGFATGRPDDATGTVMDPFTWAAGIAQATSYSAIFATSHAPTLHPIVVAKQCATVDHISGGRFGLNVVGGWNRPELEMFGASLREHDERYDYMSEWLGIIRQLWTSDEEIDFSGKFFNIVRGVSSPKPIQRAGPPIMNAGGSARGMEFAAEHADMCFVIIKSDKPDQIREQVEDYKTFARTRFGRDIQVWTSGFVVQRETRREADEYLHRYSVEFEDTLATDGWMRLQGQEAQLMPPDAMKAFRQRFVAGAGGFPLVGTAGEIADRLALLESCGVDGVVLTWVDYVDGLKRFIDDVLPLTEQAGLRVPFPGARSAASERQPAAIEA